MEVLLPRPHTHTQKPFRYVYMYINFTTNMNCKNLNLLGTPCGTPCGEYTSTCCEGALLPRTHISRCSSHNVVVGCPRLQRGCESHCDSGTGVVSGIHEWKIAVAAISAVDNLTLGCARAHEAT